MARVALVIVVKVSGGGQSSSMRVVCPTFIAAFVFSWATKHKPGSMVGTAQYGGGTSGVHGTSEAKTVATRPFQEDPLHVCYCLSDVKKTLEWFSQVGGTTVSRILEIEARARN